MTGTASPAQHPLTQESRSGSGTHGARATGLEPATSGVTGRRSNQLNYARWRAERLANESQPVAVGGGRVQHPKERLHDARVELRAGAAHELRARLLRR